MMEGRPNFRFMDLGIWQDATAIGATLFDVADKLESKRLYRFAEQLRGSGALDVQQCRRSGNSSKRDFSNFINIARRSTLKMRTSYLCWRKDTCWNEMK
jgi:hypothetical protein